MSRIATPATIAEAPAASQPLLEGVQAQLGMVPNLFRLVALSPAALQGYLGIGAALGKGALPAATRERIAFAVAEANRCGYCLSAHTYIGKNLAKLDDAEITANPQHIPQMLDAEDVAAAIAARDARIADLELKIAQLRGDA